MSAKMNCEFDQNAVELRKNVFSLASLLKDFLQVDLTIKLFGSIIWEWHFPPKSE